MAESNEKKNKTPEKKPTEQPKADVTMFIGDSNLRNTYMAFKKIIDDKFLNDLAWEINYESAKQCRKWADQIAEKTGRKRYVAGAVGPLTVSLHQCDELRPQQRARHLSRIASGLEPAYEPRAFAGSSTPSRASWRNSSRRAGCS